MTIKKMIGAAALMGVMASANAASMSLMYTGDNQMIDGVIQAEGGDALTFDLIMDFSGDGEITLGGGFDINFDAAGLTFDTYQSAGLGEASFGRDPEVQDGRLFSGAFGAFAGLTGPATVATITFIANGEAGLFNVSPSGTDGIGGPFISAVDFITVLDVDYNGADVQVVPVPAAVWFMLSGLGALVGFGRKSA
ncbi:MAG: VPLPA-CTERM sorting domain-containing protein [Gammaproteobacteria bacterium]